MMVSHSVLNCLPFVMGLSYLGMLTLAEQGYTQHPNTQDTTNLEDEPSVSSYPTSYMVPQFPVRYGDL